MRGETKRKFRLELVLLAGAFTAFCGVGVDWAVLRVANPTFLLVKPDDFQAVHHLEESRIIEVLASVGLLNIAATVSLLWVVPKGQRLWAIVALVALLVVIVVSATIQAPIHMRLDNYGGMWALAGTHSGIVPPKSDSELLVKLVRNEWIRFSAGLVEALAYLVLLFENLRDFKSVEAI